MANSKYEYVRLFEQPDTLLQNTWVVIRIDGRGFHRFSAKYEFEKPNDVRALDLMNAAAKAVIIELPAIVIAYGVSDEFSFVFHKDSSLFERRSSKLITTVVSTFSAYYVYLWQTYFPGVALSPPLPSFDGRAVCYPSTQNLRDYMSWRQVDCHINNLYNTTFWTLVLKGNLTPQEAEQKLSGTFASDKNEILFSQFGINYNNEPEIFKKGSTLFRNFLPEIESDPSQQTMGDGIQWQSLSTTASQKERKAKSKAGVTIEHLDIIKDDFWNARPWILTGGIGKLKQEKNSPSAQE